MDGFDFVRTYRKERDTPVIMLTARVEETDKVIGLELGADDYVTKPFGMAELLARIRAVLRRYESEATPSELIRVRDVTLDRATRQAKISGRSIDLTASEFDLLAILMHSAGRVFTRAELLHRLRLDAYERVERTIDVHIRNLRTKIESEPAKPSYIKTVFGVGYRFNDQDT